MIRSLAEFLGFGTVRSVAYAVGMLAAMALAMFVSPALWGLAVALAFLTGTVCDRTIACDWCGEALEEQERRES